MKYLSVFLFSFVLLLPCYAQQDIKIFDRIGHDGIVKILGQPISTDGMDGLELLEYPGNTYICIHEETGELYGFNTDSSKYCILSDFIRGGFKVGDKFSKVQKFDFVHSKYGRNRPENALKLIDSTSERDYYVVYSEEWHSFFFSVNNGVIISIDMGTPEEDDGYDKTNKVW